VNHFLHIVKALIPWVITAVALFFAFNNLDWVDLFANLQKAHLGYLASALLLTALSYTLRARRWKYLFPTNPPRFWTALQVLFLGFFMNNILPARAGEFVRAHLGAARTGHTRTLVLATILTERLIDGLTISAILLYATVGPEHLQASPGLFYVALLFVAALVVVGLGLACKELVFALLTEVQSKLQFRSVKYLCDRAVIFINGLAPLFTIRRLPYTLLWSLVIWLVELMVYICIGEAFGAELSTGLAIIFMVAVNFSSLIPAAPGGIGVIEAVASGVLVSFGVERELALAMVLTQHVMQYLVVGIPGAAALLANRDALKVIKRSDG
jgi:uncharacterized protein (TIRG00374 family)